MLLEEFPVVDSTASISIHAPEVAVSVVRILFSRVDRTGLVLRVGGLRRLSSKVLEVAVSPTISSVEASVEQSVITTLSIVDPIPVIYSVSPSQIIATRSAVLQVRISSFPVIIGAEHITASLYGVGVCKVEDIILSDVDDTVLQIRIPEAAAGIHSLKISAFGKEVSSDVIVKSNDLSITCEKCVSSIKGGTHLEVFVNGVVFFSDLSIFTVHLAGHRKPIACEMIASNGSFTVLSFVSPAQSSGRQMNL